MWLYILLFIFILALAVGVTGSAETHQGLISKYTKKHPEMFPQYLKYKFGSTDPEKIKKLISLKPLREKIKRNRKLFLTAYQKELQKQYGKKLNEEALRMRNFELKAALKAGVKIFKSKSNKSIHL